MTLSIQFKKKARMICILLFILYLMLLAYLVFLSPYFGRTLKYDRAYNLIPFKTIKNYIIYRKYVTAEALYTNIIGNIIAFMPMGFFVPIVFSNKRSFIKVIFFSTLVSLSIELLQFRFAVGSFDVDDIILNTFGGALGFIIFLILFNIYKTLWHFQKGKK